MQNEYTDYDGQYLERWERETCDEYIIYGLEHGLTAIETAQLLKYAWTAGHIKLNQEIKIETLIHRARKYGFEFVQKAAKIHPNKKESQFISSTIISGVHARKTANEVAQELNMSGQLHFDVTPKYLQRRSYVLKHGILKMN